MRVAYLGRFLKEGLISNGFSLLELSRHSDICKQIAQAGLSADFILIELFGGFSPLKQISKCNIPLIGYFIDTPLNEFWIRQIAPVFDYIFVDQLQSVDSLATYGIKATWLPLPAKKKYFQSETKKKYDITFLGTQNKFRLKRTNLLNLVKLGFEINIMSGVSANELPKIFAESKIVLNENLFPGLTLRVIQGMSAGSIVFTEKSPYKHNFGLKHKNDIIFYESGDIISSLSEVLKNYDSYSEIAKNAQKSCELNFSGAKAVETIFSVISNQPSTKSQEDFLWHETNAEFLFIQRFGGNLTDLYHRFINSAKSKINRHWQTLR